MEKNVQQEQNEQTCTERTLLLYCLMIVSTTSQQKKMTNTPSVRSNLTINMAYN